MGSQYVLGVTALECKTGDLLAQDQETADSKEHVLHALGVAAGRLRRRLGESLPSLEKYDGPPEGVTTGSLNALEAYSRGIEAQNEFDCPRAIAFFKQAISHDPNFAMAYSHVGVCDSSQDGVDSTRKAYLLRDRVSEKERMRRFTITTCMRSTSCRTTVLPWRRRPRSSARSRIGMRTCLNLSRSARATSGSFRWRAR